MYLLTSQQLKDSFQYTIKKRPVFSINLIEEIARSSYSWIVNNTIDKNEYLLFCGSGNNGAGGLALARLLCIAGNKVVVVVNQQKRMSKDAQSNFDKLPQNVKIVDCSNFDTSLIHHYTILIDAILGSGINKVISGAWCEVVMFANTLSNRFISLDIPSGVFPHAMVNNACFVKATDTLSYYSYKTIFFHPEIAVHCGKVHLIDLDYTFDNSLKSNIKDFFIDDLLIKESYSSNNASFASQDYLDSIILGGNLDRMGSLLLLSRACLRSGSPTVFINTSDVQSPILAHIPELIFVSTGSHHLEKIYTSDNAVYAISCTLEHSTNSRDIFEVFIRNTKSNLVIGSEGLKNFKNNLNFLSWTSENSVLIFSAKDFDDLFGSSENTFQRLDLAKDMSKKYNVIVILKDYTSKVIMPNGKVFYNKFENNVPAKSGTTEILIGSIAGLISKGYSSVDACILALYLNGKATEITLHSQSQESIIASDIVSNYGQVFNDISNL